MRKQMNGKWILSLVFGLGISLQAKMIYVNQAAGYPQAPYTNELHAAQTIQPALDVAEDGDEVMVALGTYTPNATLLITNNIILRSSVIHLEHAGSFVIDGGGLRTVLNLGTNRCEVLGFTIRNGAGSNGGGIYCADNTPLVWNCIFDSNDAGSGGGMYKGTASACIFTNNYAGYGGATRRTILRECTVVGNTASHGGGIYEGTAYKTKIQNNQGLYDTGGAYNCSITNCFVIGNYSKEGGGISRSTAVGSVIADNYAGSSGGGGLYSTFIHCTITGNSARSGGGIYSGTAKNSILWDNTATDGTTTKSATLYASCSPDATPRQNGCITNNPQLVSISHLGDNSPCNYAGDPAYSVFWDIDGDSWETSPAMGCDQRYGSVKGEMTPFNDLPERITTGAEIHFTAYVDGRVSQTILDFGDGTVITNFAGTVQSHAWPYGNFSVVLTGYNNEAPYRTSITNIVYVRNDVATAIYVSNDGDDDGNGESWATAKATIQAGIEVQDFSGGLVVVSNGTYALEGSIFIKKNVRVQSFEGAEVTTIQGNKHNHCLVLGNQFCTVSDFTIREGSGYSIDDRTPDGGGAISCSSDNPVVENCIITANHSGGSGGGVMRYGTANHCTFSDNIGMNGPGGKFGGIANDCLFENNDGRGGGMEYGTANRCVFKNNVGDYGAAKDLFANDCQFIGNQSTAYGGGMNQGTAKNCVFTGNKALRSGGGTYNTTAIHCIYTANQSAGTGGGNYGGTLDHCIVWYNTALEGNNDVAYGTISYSCSPDLEHGVDGNITNSPQLISSSHIALSSPCAGTGEIPRDTFDIDGENWRSTPAMGCDEPRLPYSADAVSISIDGPTDIPAGYKAFFTVDIQGAFYQDYVEFGDGQTGIHSAITPIYHTWSSTGNYDLVVSTYDENSQLLVAVTNTITVHESDFNAIYVATNGNNSAVGRSWATAKLTLQAAIDAQELPGGQVVVSNGVYRLTETVKINKDIQLIGLNGATNTVIDAIDLRGINYQISRGMEIGDNHSTVDGFTMCNASYTWTGGGIFCDYTTAPVISNCILENNQAGSAGAAFGGTFVDCTFSNNQAYSGSGGGLHSGHALRCQFTGNVSRDGGGGMYGGTADNCDFIENRTDSRTGSGYGNGAGMSKGTANDCTFSRNRSNGYGGGINEGTANDCLFIDNTAEYDGGGMRSSEANRCAFIGNRSILNTGGGMNNGVANSCYFAGNRANLGGGATSYTTLNNCTVTGNSTSGKAGGCYSGHVNNSIVWNNTAGEDEQDLYSAHPKYTCSPDAPHGTDGCITNNPQLVSASHLLPTSPCIGAGDATLVPETDIDGEAWNNPPAMGCDEIGATLSGPIEMAFYGPSPIRILTAADYTPLFDGPVSKTIVSFGHGTPLTNTIGMLHHQWPGPAAQNYEVILTGFNDDYPQGTTFTQTVEVVAGESDQHVWISGDDLADGLTWATAKQTIQAGVNAQNIYSGRILVDADTYNIPTTITIDKPVHLLGYNADGNHGITPIVDAGSSNRCFDITASGCIIENFIIQNGAASTLGYSNNEGGGIRCKTTDSTIRNTTIRNCTAYYGGAVQNGTLSSCTLYDNVATSRGGAIEGSMVWDSTITSNSAAGYGGGASGAWLANCIISTNTTQHGGGAYNSTFTNCTIFANTATSDGGAARNSTLDACNITSNSAPYGGGLSDCTADRCVISTNNATEHHGGGVYNGTTHNCTLFYNRAEERGGGSYNSALRNCTVVNNAAEEAGGAFAGYIYNSILWDNFAWTNNANVGGTTPRRSCYPEADPSNAYYSNITNNPLFAAYAPSLFFRGSDYYLSPLSPCLNAGENNQVQTDRDFNGWDRIIYGTVDMGANEMYFFNADNDGDGMPDGWELENFGGTTNAVAGEDADGDAFDNHAEYIAGTGPHDDQAFLRITQSEMVDSEGKMHITLHWSPSVEGRIYGISWSTNLVEGFEDSGRSFYYPHSSAGFENNNIPDAFYKINVRLDD